MYFPIKSNRFLLNPVGMPICHVLPGVTTMFFAVRSSPKKKKEHICAPDQDQDVTKTIY